MKRLAFVLVAIGCLLLLGMPRGTGADTSKKDKKYEEHEKRIAELEKKLAALEKHLKAPQPETEARLAGSWAAVDSKGKGLVAIRFWESDGRADTQARCRLVVSDEKGSVETLSGHYKTTGKEVQLIVSPQENQPAGWVINMTIVSMAEKKLVLKSRPPFVAKLEGERELARQ